MASDSFKELAQRIIDRVPRRRDLYADVRVVHRCEERLEVRAGRAESCQAQESLGVGLRVFMGGRWGFAATSDLKSERLDAMIARALATAGAAAYVSRSTEPFVAPPAKRVDLQDQVAIDPFRISADCKLALLEAACRLMAAEKGVKLTGATMEVWRETRVFAATTGSLIAQSTTQCGAGIWALAKEKDKIQVRSYPANFGGNYRTAGYEFIEELDLLGHAPRVASEAAQLLRAPVCPAKATTIILESSQLALQIHESIGHALELDRMLGYEASFAGTSFVGPDMVGSFRYGSPLVNVAADATTPGGLGSFGYDDEGVEGRCEWLIRDGLLVGVMSSCSTAPLVGRESSGAMRADGWQHCPLVRMTNINMMPGSVPLEELIADTEEGLWLETNRSWSIDDKRLHFQFATELAREIRRGKLGRLYRNPIYWGTTPQFWRACDGVASAGDWQLWGVPNCGKGEPMQIARVGHGCSPARFRNVEVGGVAAS